MTNQEIVSNKNLVNLIGLWIEITDGKGTYVTGTLGRDHNRKWRVTDEDACSDVAFRSVDVIRCELDTISKTFLVPTACFL